MTILIRVPRPGCGVPVRIECELCGWAPKVPKNVLVADLWEKSKLHWDKIHASTSDDPKTS